MMHLTTIYKHTADITPVAPILHISAIRPCFERFSSTFISVGSFLALTSSSSLVSLIKSTAFTRFISFSFIIGACLANFTKSAVSKRYFKSFRESLSFTCNKCSIISEDVISMALNPNLSIIYVRITSVNSV